MKYSGTFTINGSNLELNYSGSFYPKKWHIISTNTISKDNNEYLVYHVESSRDGNDGHCYSTRYYKCSIYQDGDQIDIENQSILDEE